MARKRVNPLPNTSNIQIGSRLATLRKSRGLTQTQVAEQIGINQRVISDYEVGRAGISAEMLLKLCSLLKCSADSLIGLNPEATTPRPSPRIYRYIQRIEGLPAKEQSVLMQTIDHYIKGSEQE